MAYTYNFPKGSNASMELDESDLHEDVIRAAEIVATNMFVEMAEEVDPDDLHAAQVVAARAALNMVVVGEAVLARYDDDVVNEAFDRQARAERTRARIENGKGRLAEELAKVFVECTGGDE